MEDFYKSAHMGALVFMGQIHIHIDVGNGILGSFLPVEYRNRVLKILYPDLVDGNVTVVFFVLNVSHSVPVPDFGCEANVRLADIPVSHVSSL